MPPQQLLLLHNLMALLPRKSLPHLHQLLALLAKLAGCLQEYVARVICSQIRLYLLVSKLLLVPERTVAQQLQHTLHCIQQLLLRSHRLKSLRALRIPFHSRTNPKPQSEKGLHHYHRQRLQHHQVLLDGRLHCLSTIRFSRFKRRKSPVETHPGSGIRNPKI
jgi:hypothetical protein